MDIGTLFVWTKVVHVTCVTISITLFTARGVWVIATSRGLWSWLRVVPHMNDSILLASGLTMAVLIHQYPFYNSDWLTAKVVGLVVYITLGSMLFRGSRDRVRRSIIGVFALVVFAYIVSVALTMNPEGFLVFV